MLAHLCSGAVGVGTGQHGRSVKGCGVRTLGGIGSVGRRGRDCETAWGRLEDGRRGLGGISFGGACSGRKAGVGGGRIAIVHARSVAVGGTGSPGLSGDRAWALECLEWASC